MDSGSSLKQIWKKMRSERRKKNFKEQKISQYRIRRKTVVRRCSINVELKNFAKFFGKKNSARVTLKLQPGLQLYLRRDSGADVVQKFCKIIQNTCFSRRTARDCFYQ